MESNLSGRIWSETGRRKDGGLFRIRGTDDIEHLQDQVTREVLASHEKETGRGWKGPEAPSWEVVQGPGRISDDPDVLSKEDLEGLRSRAIAVMEGHSYMDGPLYLSVRKGSSAKGGDMEKKVTLEAFLNKSLKTNLKGKGFGIKLYGERGPLSEAMRGNETALWLQTLFRSYSSPPMPIVSALHHTQPTHTLIGSATIAESKKKRWYNDPHSRPVDLDENKEFDELLREIQRGDLMVVAALENPSKGYDENCFALHTMGKVSPNHNVSGTYEGYLLEVVHATWMVPKIYVKSGPFYMNSDHYLISGNLPSESLRLGYYWKGQSGQCGMAQVETNEVILQAALLRETSKV